MLQRMRPRQTWPGRSRPRRNRPPEGRSPEGLPSEGRSLRGRSLRGWLRQGWLLLPGGRRRARAALLGAALAAAERGWPVLPGAYWMPGALGECSCADPCCPAPGAHPHEPPLLAASTDARMVSWWWEQRSPESSVLVATGGTVCAVSLPAEAGSRVLEHFTLHGVPLGPVLATAGRFVLLVAPYTLAELGELLAEQPWVPGSLRYHGPDGYLVLPPSRTGEGGVRWGIRDSSWEC